MNRVAALLLLSLFFTLDALSPEDFRIKSLPYLDQDLPEGYAGFLPVTEPADQSDPDSALFFWLTMKNDGTDYDENTPLLLWLNGGPGASSQIGLFTQNGPYKVLETDGKPKVILNEYSWSKFGHLLVVDQPIGTGYSYAKDDSLFVTTDQQGAEQFRQFLKNFFSVFPDLAKNSFYLTGESYCGKYHPYMARQILNHPEDKINLKALLLGNGYMEPALQRTTMPILSGAAGLVSGNMMPQIEALKKDCLVAEKTDPTHASEVCNKIPDYISTVSGGIDLYNINNIDTGETQPYIKYLNGQYSKKVLEELHVTQSPKSPIYAPTDEGVGQALASVNIDSSVPIMNELLEREFPMLLYIGQFDTQDGVAGQEQILKLFEWEKKKEFMESPRWLYKTEAGALAGYFKQVKNLSWMIFIRSGHLAPTDQPENALAMISDYISNGYSMPTRKGYDDAQKAMCQFMNQCNRHGKCNEVNGLCKCDEGYLGADCNTHRDSIKSIHQIKNYVLAPKQWVYVHTSSYTHITSSRSFSMFGVKDHKALIPSQEVYDIKSEQVIAYIGSEDQNYILGIYNPNQKDELQLDSLSGSPLIENTERSSLETVLLITLNILVLVAVVMMGLLLKRRGAHKEKDFEREMSELMKVKQDYDLAGIQV